MDQMGQVEIGVVFHQHGCLEQCLAVLPLADQSIDVDQSRFGLAQQGQDFQERFAGQRSGLQSRRRTSRQLMSRVLHFGQRAVEERRPLRDGGRGRRLCGAGGRRQPNHIRGVAGHAGGKQENQDCTSGECGQPGNRAQHTAEP
ncbi:hypothetical protein D3C72_1825390 [compost metagenome]